MGKIMTLVPRVRKKISNRPARTPLLGQFRHRGGRLAALGLPFLVAAGFSVVTASAGIASASKQRVRCVSGMGVYRREDACKTQMRLVCHKSPGRTVLQRIPKDAYYAGTWNIEFSPYRNQWGPNGPPVKSGRLSIATPRGARREEVIVSRLVSAPPGEQVVISVRCS